MVCMHLKPVTFFCLFKNTQTSPVLVLRCGGCIFVSSVEHVIVSWHLILISLGKGCGSVNLVSTPSLFFKALCPLLNRIKWAWASVTSKDPKVICSDWVLGAFHLRQHNCQFPRPCEFCSSIYLENMHFPACCGMCELLTTDVETVVINSRCPEDPQWLVCSVMVLKVAQYRACWYSAHIIKQHLPRLGGTVIYSVIQSLFVHHPVPTTVFIQNWFLPIRTISKLKYY